MINPNVAKLRVSRARGATQFKCNYKLGRGGFSPKFMHNPAWDAGRSDCSGFVSWVLMTKRAPKEGRPFWIETSAIFRDAINERKVFCRLESPEVGCLVVYGDSGGKQGHIGIVVAVRHGLSSKPLSIPSYDTVECASGPLGLIGKAIRLRTDAQKLFGKRGAIFVCLKEDLQ